MTTVLGGIKTETIRWTKNNGYYCIAFPLKQSQLNSLLKKNFEWFYGTGDYKLPKTIGHEREGEIYRANCRKLYEWITKECDKHFPKNSMVVHSRGYNDPWFNIPIGHPATKDWLIKVGHITDESIIKRMRKMGNSKWGGVYYNKNAKIDKNVMTKKGLSGEEVLKQHYFEKQPSITKVELSGDTYAFWDVKIEYN